MRLLRSLIAAALAGFVVLAGGWPALAAVPAQDSYAGRSVVGSLPYTATADTSEATTDADDAALNGGCGAPATEASVWYEWTAPTDMGVLVDTAGTSYSAGVLIGVGAPGSLELVTCAGKAVVFFAEAGQHYLVLAVDDQDDGGGNGGALQVSVSEAPPPPSIDVTVDPSGTVDAATGAATLTGTVRCRGSGEDLSAGVDVELQQVVGAEAVRGWGFRDIACDGERHPWSAVVVPDAGAFSAGAAASVTFGTACGPWDCGTDYQERLVMLDPV